MTKLKKIDNSKYWGYVEKIQPLGIASRMQNVATVMGNSLVVLQNVKCS